MSEELSPPGSIAAGSETVPIWIWRFVRGLPGTLGLILFGVILGFLLSEAAAIVALPAPLAERWPPSMVVPDPDLGWRMMPHDIHYTYTYRVEVNEDGLRNPLVGPKQPQEFRVLVLGDSEVYGQGLPEADLFTTRLQTALNTSSGRDTSRTFNVINSGVRAYSTDQEVAFLKKTGLAMQPDLVLLCVYVNDLELVAIKQLYDHATSVNNGAPYLFDLRMPSGVAARLLWEGVQLLRRSRVLMYTHDVIFAYYASDTYEMRLIAGVVDDDIRQRVAVFKHQLEAFRDLLAAHRTAGTIVIIPAPEQVRNRARPARYQDLVTSAATEVGLPVIDLLPAFRARFHDSLPVLPYDPHYDASANALIAETLMGHLAPQVASEKRHVGS